LDIGDVNSLHLALDNEISVGGGEGKSGSFPFSVEFNTDILRKTGRPEKGKEGVFTTKGS
jgi:hypothetical protein